jgi:hypothetical protein
MGLMDGISIVVAKLLNNLLDPVKFFGSSKIPDDSFKTARWDKLLVTKQRVCCDLMLNALLKSSNLPLVIELVIQGALDARIHGDGIYLACKYMLYLSDVEYLSRVLKRFGSVQFSSVRGE